MKGHTLLAALVVLLSQILGVYSTTFQEDTTLTRLQSSNFQKFKAQVIPKIDQAWMKEDLYLLRFFKAKNFDVNRAVDYLNSHLAWRREYKMDSVDNEDWSDMTTDYHYDVNYRDKEGRVIMRWDLEDWDIRKQVVAGKMNRLLTYTYKMMSEANRKADFYASQGQNTTRFVIVVGMGKVNAIQHINPTGIPYFLNVAAAYEAQFPRMGDNMYLVNTPGLFETVLTLVRPILSDHNRKSIVVFGKDPKVWKPILDQHIDESQLPPRYGGTLVES